MDGIKGSINSPIASFAADAAKRVALRYAERGVQKLTEMAQQGRPFIREVGLEQDRCPYCSAAKHLCGALMYMRRVYKKSDLTLTYQKLMRYEIRDALLTVYALRSSNTTSDIAAALNTVDLELAEEVSPERMNLIYSKVNDLVERLMDMAEEAH